eukprot:1172869-Prymnesium_polylepis.1
MHDPTWPEGRTNLSPRACVAVVPRTVRFPSSRNIFTRVSGQSGPCGAVPHQSAIHTPAALVAGHRGCSSSSCARHPCFASRAARVRSSRWCAPPHSRLGLGARRPPCAAAREAAAGGGRR